MHQWYILSNALESVNAARQIPDPTPQTSSSGIPQIHQYCVLTVQGQRHHGELDLLS